MSTKHVVCVIIMFFNFALTSSTRVKRGSGPKRYPLSKSQMSEIVEKHNQLRSTLHSSDMRFMTWDDELAQISADYGTKCQFSHNQEGSHSKFKNSIGENIYVAKSPPQTFDVSRAIQLWFDEKAEFDYKALTCTPGAKCGHYTQIAWAKTYKVGCSLTMCDEVTGFHKDSHLFICNYSPAGNVYSYQSGESKMLSPFTKGSPCSKCMTSSDVCSSKLCANAARDQTSLPLNPNLPPQNSGIDATGDSGSSNSSLIAAVVVLSLLLLAALLYICYRERNRMTSALNPPQQRVTSQHNKFSNPNTPVPSRLNTPRQSLAGGNLHGISKPNAPPPLRPEIQRIDKAPRSAPCSPYRPGIPTRPPPPSVAL
ncbi:uncharacterized protein LOC143465620 [Clavelina lepadiformis]|uniref:uncharacterized protein LOC143465620 n=1 Tax=Clavelina lepadiformis TaxID=159417 RepID=UPI004042BFBD